jgi:hypothetical protein
MGGTKCTGKYGYTNRKQEVERHLIGLNRHRLLAVRYLLVVWKVDKYLDG